MQPNWDPDVKKFLLKVLNSVSLVLLWMMASATAGIYFELAYTNGRPVVYTILFLCRYDNHTPVPVKIFV